MAEINTTGNLRNKKNRRLYYKHQSPKTDMTPMVDLGFLLISFFVITTAMSEPRTTDLYMPIPGGPGTKIGESNALTFLLGEDNTIYYYHGNWTDAVAKNQVIKIVGDQKRIVREIVSAKQQYLDQHNQKEGRDGLMFLIKPGKDAFYGNVIDIMDEAIIHNVKKYAVLPIETQQAAFLEENSR